uniref:Retrograde Golgi transport protein RGP1-like protein n=1 Tax=Magallana gigas TaxID=29159 RepID=K1QWX9_MAGGI
MVNIGLGISKVEVSCKGPGFESRTPCTCDTSSCVDARCLVFVLCTVAFEDVIPADAPPSYRGQAIKYSYKLIIGAQMLEHPTKLLRIPFRVLVLHGMNDVSVYMDTEEVQPSNPFLKQEQNENNLLDIAMQVLATITARKAPPHQNEVGGS